jgi:g-D-glutamyl-meso-diaminopimelate peptidase
MTGIYFQNKRGFTSNLVENVIRTLCAMYPFARAKDIGRSVLGRPLYVLVIGEGPRKVFVNAAHHANEWITSLVLLRFAAEYLAAVDKGGLIYDADARALYKSATLHLLPLVNPDGADLVNGQIEDDEILRRVQQIAGRYPHIPFPDGWKANIRGVDLNLQYPAGWEFARVNKAEIGVVSPAPRDYPGPCALSEPESIAVFNYTLENGFDLTLSYHTQGKVIYWKYLDIDVKNALEIALELKKVSGYEVEDVPYASGFAGYKDWFIKHFRRPGFTIEAGEGVSPLPLEQLDEIYADNLGVIIRAVQSKNPEKPR